MGQIRTGQITRVGQNVCPENENFLVRAESGVIWLLLKPLDEEVRALIENRSMFLERQPFENGI